MILIQHYYKLSRKPTPLVEYPSHGLQQIIAEIEPLEEDGSPPHHEARNRSAGWKIRWHNKK